MGEEVEADVWGSDPMSDPPESDPRGAAAVSMNPYAVSNCYPKHRHHVCIPHSSRERFEVKNGSGRGGLVFFFPKWFQSKG